MHPADLSRAAWRKSSYSNGTGGSCVEIATLPRPEGQYQIAVRDSKDPDGPVLAFTPAQWRLLTASIKVGHLLGDS
jgi:Domain of unknown function (DUF397)